MSTSAASASPIARLLGASLALCASGAIAAVTEVRLRQDGDNLHVQASALLRADPQTTWDTLVGYDTLPRFVPDMLSSRTVFRHGERAVVEQTGAAGFGPFKQRFAVTLAVREDAPQAVTAEAVAGDFSRFESGYRLAPQPDGTLRLDYAATIEPRSGIPPLVGLPVMRSAIRRQFDALAAEIERRAAGS